MNPQSIAVVFDMDGVLLDTERLIMGCYHEAAREMGLPSSDDIYISVIGRNTPDTRDVYAQHYGMKQAVLLDERVTELTNVRIARFGAPVKPGAKDLLSYLKQRGCRLALASSSSAEEIALALGGAGLISYFETIASGDTVTHCKPDPEIYIWAFEALGAINAAGYAVEDSPAGVRSAAGAGLKPLLVPDLQQPDDAVKALAYRVYENLFDVQAYFASIL